MLHSVNEINKHIGKNMYIMIITDERGERRLVGSTNKADVNSYIKKIHMTVERLFLDDVDIIGVMGILVNPTYIPENILENKEKDISLWLIKDESYHYYPHCMEDDTPYLQPFKSVDDITEWVETELSDRSNDITDFSIVMGKGLELGVYVCTNQ